MLVDHELFCVPSRAKIGRFVALNSLTLTIFVKKSRLLSRTGVKAMTVMVFPPITVPAGNYLEEAPIPPYGASSFSKHRQPSYESKPGRAPVIKQSCLPRGPPVLRRRAGPVRRLCRFFVR
jgi:hypothetical protein